MVEAIGDLEARAVVDRELIEALVAEGVADRQRIRELKEALATARLIGAAVGIVMAVRHVSEREAFASLVKTSQHTNSKLRDVADDVYVKGVEVLS